MNIIKKTIAIAALSLSSIAAQAEIITGDWQESGDQLLVTDTVTGMSWLKLTQTAGMTVNEAISETGVGGLFEGFRLGRRDEILSVAYQATWQIRNAVRDGLTSIQVDYMSQIYLRSWFGNSDINGYKAYSKGWLDNGNGGIGHIGLTSERYGISSPLTDHTADQKNPNIGVYLIQKTDDELLLDPGAGEVGVSVPAPASLGLLALAMAGFGFRQKNKQGKTS